MKISEFEAPKITLLNFEVEDPITASGFEEEDSNNENFDAPVIWF